MRAACVSVLVALLGCRGGAAAAPQGIRVIGAGVSRTSTQSLSLALTRLGIKTLHAEGFHPEISMWRESPELVDMVTKAAQRSFSEQDFSALVPVLEKIESLNISALVDIPWSEYGVELSQRYPQAKVIATVREKHSWYKSYWEHFRWGALLPPPPFPSFPITQPFPLTVLYQPFAQYWRLVSQRINCGAVTRFPPWPLTEAEQQACLDGFEEHVEVLRRAVPPENLLIYNIREGWEPLCKFLGVPVPDEPFPRHDAYSHIHWKAGPVAFIVVVYFCYGLVFGMCGYLLLSIYRRYLRKAAMPFLGFAEAFQEAFAAPGGKED